jgi:hypothetical protein
MADTPKSDDEKRDEVLRKMLSTPRKQHKTGESHGKALPEKVYVARDPNQLRKGKRSE